MAMRLTRREQETIFICNEVDNIGELSTYNRSKQRDIEKRLNIQPSSYLDCGGRVYKIPKSYFKLYPPRVLSAETRERYAEHARQINLRRHLTKVPAVAIADSCMNQDSQ
jgi:hypothetical protein